MLCKEGAEWQPYGEPLNSVANSFPEDKSNGYDRIAQTFMRARNPRIGSATVREWSKSLSPGTVILDLACGYGVPISQALIDEGFAVWGVDASPSLMAAFRERFPNAPAECAAVEDSEFFRRTFDAVVAWGLMFLLPAETQATVIRKVARALNSGGRFLFTSLAKPFTWSDTLTGRTSISLGREKYEEILRAEGLSLVGDAVDEGDNYYYFVRKPPTLAA